jgi:hypothetical protein
MSKSFMDEVREFKNLYENSLDTTKEDTADDLIELSALKQKVPYAAAEKLIAIDDIVTKYTQFTSFSGNNQAHSILKQIRQILEGESK